MIAPSDFLKGMLAGEQAKEMARLDAETATACTELAAFDHHPAALQKAHAHTEAMKVKMARAEADLAAAKANYVEANAAEHRLAQQHSYALAQLRARALNRPRWDAAYTRLLDYMDQVRKQNGIPIREAHDRLVKVMHTLGGMGSGAIDPVEDYEAIVDAAIADAEAALDRARAARRQADEKAAQDARKKKILS